jgi:hypothetical protein
MFHSMRFRPEAFNSWSAYAQWSRSSRRRIRPASIRPDALRIAAKSWTHEVPLMGLTVRLGLTPVAWGALTGLDRLSWRLSVLHRRLIAALCAVNPLDHKLAKPE